MMRILLTGMSGTGKSSVIHELAARGYRTVDMDDPGWSEARDDGEWVWREDGVESLLSAEGAGALFVSGCASNQVKFHSHFDHIILLSAPEEVIVRRLADRTNNPFGKRAGELDKVLSDLRETEPKLRRVATSEIDTTAPLSEVVKTVLHIAGEQA